MGGDADKKVKRKNVLRFLPLFRIKRKLDHPFEPAIISLFPTEKCSFKSCDIPSISSIFPIL
jgi:hypothetical protein